MKHLAILAVLILALVIVSAVAAVGFTTINLRTCVDAGDGACLTESGDIAVDGVTVCLQAVGETAQCGGTEDGEHWYDSLEPGRYTASVRVPKGYTLSGATCTIWPTTPYQPCKPQGNKVRLAIDENVDAVNVNFLLTPTSTLNRNFASGTTN